MESKKSRGRCEGVRGCASHGLGGPLKTVSQQDPQGHQKHWVTPLRARRHGGGLTAIICEMKVVVTLQKRK